MNSTKNEPRNPAVLSTDGLCALITGAIQLAGGDAVSHGARLWQFEGGRKCPIGWLHCSQSVYVDLKTGQYDYGEPGGPGYADCERNCKHRMQPPQEEDDGYMVHNALDQAPQPREGMR